MSRITTIAAMTLLVTTALTGCDIQTETVSHVETGAAAPIEKVIITVDIGDVVVRSSKDGTEVRTEAELQWADQRPNLTFKRSGTSLYVTSSCKDSDPACRADLTMTVPALAAVTIAGGDTAIDVAVLSGAVNLSSAEGDIKLDTMYGPLTLDADQGQIHGINLRSHTASVIASDSLVDLDFKLPPDSVKIETRDGDVQMLLPIYTYNVDAQTRGVKAIGVEQSSTAPRRISVHSVSGDITIRPQPPAQPM